MSMFSLLSCKNCSYYCVVYEQTLKMPRVQS